MKKLSLFVLALVILGCADPEPRKPVSYTSGSFIKTSADRNKKLNESEKLEIQAAIKKESDTQFLASEHGFWYRYDVRAERDTITPQFGDIVNYTHEVQDLNGRVFYSKEALGTRNYKIDQEELFLGLREGLKLMKPNETVTFFFPSQIAYGYYGDEQNIGTNVPLKCIVTLNSIIKQTQ